jgi:hypothetical protein
MIKLQVMKDVGYQWSIWSNNNDFISDYISWDSSAGIVTGYGLDALGSIPSRSRNWPLLHWHTSSGAHPASYTMGIGDKTTGVWSWTLGSNYLRGKEWCSYTSTALCLQSGLLNEVWGQLYLIRWHTVVLIIQYLYTQSEYSSKHENDILH